MNIYEYGSEPYLKGWQGFRECFCIPRVLPFSAIKWATEENLEGDISADGLGICVSLPLLLPMLQQQTTVEQKVNMFHLLSIQ